MNIPKYWAKAESTVLINRQEYHFVAYKGSDEGQNHAQQLADEALLKRIAQKEHGEKLGNYPKHGAPLREEIIEEIFHHQERIAIITRNAAGSLVLNTARVMFIDVDLMQVFLWKGQSFGEILKGMFGFTRSKPKTRGEAVLERIHQWHSQHPDFGVRVYRTKAGFRLLVTHAVFNPNGDIVKHIMNDLQCDNRYTRLCAIQSCFRARLTPKYWRLKLERPPVRYPWDNPEQELLQREWEVVYHQKIGTYDVCHLVETLGNTSIHPEAKVVMDVHDKFVMSGENRPLA
jgi:hypothetical protein